MALVLPFTDASCDAALPEVQRVLARHGVVALPTETYYGLAVRPTDEAALRRLVEVKGRPPDKPILVLIGAPEQLVPLVDAITPAASLLMERFWPGPLTIVFPAASGLSPLLTAGSGTIGVRWSPLPVLQRLLTHTGPLTGTSANRSSESPLADAGAVQKVLGSCIDLILDGGRAPGGSASTVVDACECPRLLRAGVIAADHIRAALEQSGYILSS
ncbi:MAG: threonylcarbamoyl-AMP synthase [Nitrospira sp.]|uniref:L-threonylcarbamoyladenylate synthase n=1 Tax=Nitrospira defluvii TaxID=330214 RepID=A0ABN7LUZ8_9BACT|nr:L-threonylcarbamoyladenylate synthase [Nitrospira defluvii]MCS6326508.1 threonylcarbamoyl-AMP synthase [Nitrospira sp.]CAE6769668.1 Sua5 YciO YrdC YwlC family protein [Nitrospira defluvii]